MGEIGFAEGSPYTSNLETGGVDAEGPWYYTISNRPCDFNYNYIDMLRTLSPKGKACGGTGSFPIAYYYAGTSGACVLEPNSWYYINLRHEDASSEGNNRGKVQNGVNGTNFSSPNTEVSIIP